MLTITLLATTSEIPDRVLYLLILGVCLAASMGIGYFFSRRHVAGNSYFIGKGDMKGWLVGCSLAATMISTMTFLAIPAFSFKEDYRWVVPSFSFLIMGIFAIAVLVPFFRKENSPSGYAFLEQRFGSWARVYAAGGFLLFNVLRLGVVLYVTCLSLEVFFGIPAIWLMIIVGISTTIYTMMGGFEAVVWTEFFQAIVLVLGAVVMVPVVLHAIPGGMDTVFEMARPAGKMSVGSLEFSFAEKTLWVMILASLFYNASDYATRQDFIQRYRAASSANQARIAIAISAVAVVPIWLYFNFLGTALWTFYQINPDPVVTEISQSSPEKIVPYFMTTNLSPALNGLILAALVMASLSTLAPILSACAATWVGDFHERVFRGKTSADNVRLGRISTQIMGVVMVIIACVIHALRTQTLQDLQATGQMLFSAGLFGLFMVGFFGRRIGPKPALLAVITTVSIVGVWFAAHSASLASWVPDPFWIPVLSNIGLPLLALFYSRVLQTRTVVSSQNT